MDGVMNIPVISLLYSLHTAMSRVLLALKPLPDRSNQSADNHVNLTKETLSRYDKSLESIAFLVADNANLNPKIARMIQCPFVGCYSHKLNLAISKYNSYFSIELQKIDLVVKRLKSNNMFGILETVQLESTTAALHPKSRNVTRWPLSKWWRDTIGLHIT